MSLTTNLFLFAAFIFFMLLLAYRRKRKKKIIFFGDSLTVQGALFGGFIQRLATYMQQEDIAAKYELTGMGKDGNIVQDLLNRLGKDVLERGADYLVLFIGVNDVWQWLATGTGMTEQAFSEAYKTLVEKIKATGIKPVLCTPAVIGENMDETNAANAMLERYCDIIRQQAALQDLPLADIRLAFKNYLHEHNTSNVSHGLLTTDGVHLTTEGNTLVAEEIWKAMKDMLGV